MKQSNVKTARDALKTHYAEQSLSEDQLNHLMAMQQDLSHTEGRAERYRYFGRLQSLCIRCLERFKNTSRDSVYAMYALIAAVLVSWVLLQLVPREPLMTRIMGEIAYNHRQDMPVEVSANALDDIRQYLDRLNFTLAQPRTLSQQGDWSLLGGRYCSINGKLAAQLKVKNLTDDTIYTLYQTATERSTQDFSADPRE